MMISRPHKFIFIRVPKTACSSMREALNKYCDVNHIFKPHLQASTAMDILTPEIWRDCFKFSFVRHPLDRLVSQYHYILKHKDLPHNRFVENIHNIYEYLRFDMSDYTFHHQRERNRTLQKSWVVDGGGKLLVDYVGRFENLEQDFFHVTNTVGIGRVELPHINTTTHKPYMEYYDTRTLDLAYEIFHEDFEFFGYEMP